MEKFKSGILKDFVKQLINNGFRVYRSGMNEPITYVHIEKDGNVGYIQNNYFSGLDFCTVHKPNLNTGTGFRIETGIGEPSIKHALGTFIFKPRWSDAEAVDIIKYGSFKEFQERETVLSYVEIKEA